MSLVIFTRALQAYSPESLVDLAHRLPIDGYDLCIRPGHPVTPDNALETLPRVATLFRREGLEVPLATAPTDLVAADDPRARSILPALDKADLRLLKLGYFRFDPARRSYAEELNRARERLAGWEKLARQHRVKVCYHTHSGDFLGRNGAGLAQLLDGLDPSCVGAYLDPGHLVVDGEQFPMAVAMVTEHLAAVALKDVLLSRAARGNHGTAPPRWAEAGQGMVDWTGVADTLRAVGFQGPLSMHCEFEVPADQFDATLAREAVFFRRVLCGRA